MLTKIVNSLLMKDRTAMYRMYRSIELFIADPAFSRSYDLAPPPTPPPLSASCLSFSVSLPVCHRSSFLTDGGGGRGVGGAKSYDCNKTWPSINHSILSGCIDPRMQANHWGSGTVRYNLLPKWRLNAVFQFSEDFGFGPIYMYRIN
jgi:hypothetical protein